jgi:hypothetical protein
MNPAPRTAMAVSRFAAPASGFISPAAAQYRVFLARLSLAACAVALSMTVSLFALVAAEPPLLTSLAARPPPVAYFSFTLPEVAQGGAQEISSSRLELIPTPVPVPEAHPLPVAAPVPAGRPAPVATPSFAATLARLQDVERVMVTGTIQNVNLTFYDCLGQGFCGRMAGGRVVYEGAAACSYDLRLGTRFRIVGDPTGRVYVCEDRGLLSPTWIDVFWRDPADGWRWQAAVGRWGTIEILYVP